MYKVLISFNTDKLFISDQTNALSAALLPSKQFQSHTNAIL